MAKKLMKGNEALVYGALLGGSTHYFGYPITPASEIAHSAALYYPKCGREFLQAECEVASINMLYGAASAGARTMTGTAGPGLSLMAEGLSYISGAELPCVVVDVQRSGPGLGYIYPEQSDYNFMVHGAGHGNHHGLVLAPDSAQEMCDFAYEAFELAEKYRCIVYILSDAYIGQMMEPVQLPTKIKRNVRKDWAVYGDEDSRENVITSIYLKVEELEAHNEKLQAKYRRMEEEEVMFEEIDCADADYILIAYGVCARVCKTAVSELRESGLKVGLLRPQTLFPFPTKRIVELTESAKEIITVEMSEGMMHRDVRLAVGDRVPTKLYNWMGGHVPSSNDIVEKIKGELKDA